MTDGGHPEDDADPLDRQADALEAIATELRYQNAVMVEVVSTLDEVARRADENHFTDGEPPNRSGTALQTAVADHLYQRDESEDSLMSTLGRADNWEGSR